MQRTFSRSQFEAFKKNQMRLLQKIEVRLNFYETYGSVYNTEKRVRSRIRKLKRIRQSIHYLLQIEHAEI